MDSATFDALLKAASVPQTNPPGLWSDTKRGFGQLVEGRGSALRDVPYLGGLGEAVEQYGTGLIERNPAQINSWEDVKASPLVAGREGVGEAVGQLGGRIPEMWLGAKAGAALMPLPHPLAKLAAGAVGGLTGAIFPSIVQEYGSIRNDQREGGQEDKTRALAAAVPAGLLEGAFGPEAVVARKLLGQGAKGLTEAAAREVAARGLMGTVGREGLKTAVVEGPMTEIPQTALERWGAFKDVTSPEAISEYGVAGFKGAAGGGAIGGALGPMTRASASGFVDQIDTARETLTAPLTDINQLGLKQQAAEFLQGVLANDVGSAQALEFAAQQAERITGEGDAFLETVSQKTAAAKLAEANEAQQKADQEAIAARQKQVDDFIKLLDSDEEAAAKQEETQRVADMTAAGAERVARDSGFVHPQMILPDGQALLPGVQPDTPFADQMAAVPAPSSGLPVATLPIPDDLQRLIDFSDALKATMTVQPAPATQMQDALKQAQIDAAYRAQPGMPSPDIWAAADAERQAQENLAYAQRELQAIQPEPFPVEQTKIRGPVQQPGQTQTNLPLDVPNVSTYQQKLQRERVAEATEEQVPDLTNADEFVSEGLRIGAELQKAREVEDTAAEARLQADAVRLMDQMAMGLGKKPDTTTPEMFGLQSAGKRPRVLSAATRAAGGIDGSSGPAATDTAQGDTQGRVDAGNGVDASGLDRGRGDAASRAGVPGGVQGGEAAVSSVEPAVADAVVQPVQEVQNGPVEESPVPTQGTDEGQNAYADEGQNAYADEGQEKGTLLNADEIPSPAALPLGDKPQGSERVRVENAAGQEVAGQGATEEDAVWRQLPDRVKYRTRPKNAQIVTNGVVKVDNPTYAEVVQDYDNDIAAYKAFLKCMGG